jgi:hypothetical protein
MRWNISPITNYTSKNGIVITWVFIYGTRVCFAQFWPFYLRHQHIWHASRICTMKTLYHRMWHIISPYTIECDISFHLIHCTIECDISFHIQEGDISFHSALLDFQKRHFFRDTVKSNKVYNEILTFIIYTWA